MKCTSQISTKGILTFDYFPGGPYLRQKSYLQGLEEVALILLVSSTSLPSKHVCIAACSPCSHLDERHREARPWVVGSSQCPSYSQTFLLKRAFQNSTESHNIIG